MSIKPSFYKGAVRRQMPDTYCGRVSPNGGYAVWQMNFSGSRPLSGEERTPVLAWKAAYEGYVQAVPLAGSTA